MMNAKWAVLVETTRADATTERIEIAALERDVASPTLDDLGLRLAETVLHGSAGGAGGPSKVSVRRLREADVLGRPGSSMRFNAFTAIATSVARRRSVGDRSPSPMTRLKGLMSASTMARQ